MRGKTWWALLVGMVAALWTQIALAQTNGAANLAPGFMPDPQTLSGVSGGMIQAQTLNPSCRGWIAPTPNHVMNLAGGFAFLRTYVESQSDTTLVIRAPNGQFLCNDDTFGLNPDIDAAYGPGQYYVWVGSYSQTNSGPYTITFSELQTTRPASAMTNPGIPGMNPAMPMMAPPSGAAHRVTVSSGAGGRIFDNHTTDATAVVGQACTIGGLNINVRGRHTFSSDMVVRLRGPSGDTETLQSHESRSPFRRYPTSHFNGSSGMGTWTLSIEDTVGQDSGQLNGFTLQLDCI